MLSGLFDGPGDGDQHLVDGHDAVIHADDDAREIGLGEDRDGDGERQVDADRHQRQDDEDDRLAVAGGPVRRFRLAHFGLAVSPRLSSGPSSAVAAPSFVGSSSVGFLAGGVDDLDLGLVVQPMPPRITTSSPGLTPLRICTLSPSRTPTWTVSAVRHVDRGSRSTAVPPSSPGKMAEAGTTAAALNELRDDGGVDARRRA